MGHRIIFDSDALDGTGITEADAEAAIFAALAQAETLADSGYRVLNDIMGKSSRRKKKQAWEDHTLVSRYFGSDAPAVASIRAVRRRLRRCRRRICNRTLKIHVKAQPSNHSSARGQNLGFFLTPLRFRVFPAFFGTLDAEADGATGNSSNSDLRRAAIIVHELMHDWFGDKKDGGDTVYGEAAAKKLARDHPGKARRNPENYEWFCMRLIDASGSL